MNKWIIMLAGAVLAGSLQWAEAERKPPVMLKVSRKINTDRTTTQSGGNNSNRKSRGGRKGNNQQTKRTTKTSATMSITIDVWNLDQAEQEYKVQWYYVADPAASGEDRYVYDEGSETLKLKAREQHKITHESSSLTETRSSGNKSTKSGDKPVGFIVIVNHGEDVVASDASSWSLKRIVQNPITRQAFIDTGAL